MHASNYSITYGPFFELTKKRRARISFDKVQTMENQRISIRFIKATANSNSWLYSQPKLEEIVRIWRKVGSLAGSKDRF